MGVYIKGMEMPKSCLNCFLSRSGCRAVLKRMRAMEAGTWIPANYRHDDCPLVPVPNHGDLIDRDALAEDGWVLTKQVMRMGGYAIHELPLKNPTIPVIIPASEEGET